MADLGTYYLGRVIKLGQLTESTLIDTLKDASPVLRSSNAWTFVNVEERKSDLGEYVFGRLCKYSPDAVVHVINPERHLQENRLEPNLLIASSPFIYIPRFSGLAFLRVPNHIEPTVFTKRFCDIIVTMHKKFFVDCIIDMVADLQTFSTKLMKLSAINRIQTIVSPPNPLFGPLWEPLKEYIKKRNSERMKIEEQCALNTSINTNIHNHVDGILNQTPDEPYEPTEVLDIGDAALLMAIDGYGEGLVEGQTEIGIVRIKTSESTKQFHYFKEPEPDELHEIASRIFTQITDERHMQH